MSDQDAPSHSTGGTRTLLGFDFGTKRIGVAVGQELTGTANALTTLQAHDGRPDWNALAGLIEQWQPDALVVGLPLNMDGTEHEVTVAARRFGERLRGRYNLPVFYCDERLSSIAAEQTLAGSTLSRRKRQRREMVDQVAAQIILQAWLEQQRNP
ncbi:MAG: Holliday junction resolvase RuvX [Gammaproteobacteria bacterium]